MQSAFLSFGGGSFLCTGRHFANHETSSGLAAMFLKLKFQVDEKSLKKLGFPKLNLSQQGGMRPDRTFKVRVRRRRSEK
jgi:cytochrome P450